MKNKFEQATVDELKKGFIYDTDAESYNCLFCNTKYEAGNIYESGSQFIDANKAMRLHIREKHQSVFDALLSSDKKQTGITDVQKEFLLGFFNGNSDNEIASATETSPSTVRFQRYNFREKAKQAKIILAVSDLLEEKIEKNTKKAKIKENTVKNDIDEKKMNIFFKSISPLVLNIYSTKQKNHTFILNVIARQFESGKKYTEKQVNAILKSIYSDYATIRRALIDYGFMERKPDCSEYWLKEN